MRSLRVPCAVLLVVILAGSRRADSQDPRESIVHPGVWELDFSSDGRWLAAATNLRDKGGPVVVWSVGDWKPHIVRFEETGGLHVAFSPDSKRIAYSTREPKITLLDVESGDVIREIDAHAGFAYCVEFTPDGQSLVTSGDDHSIKLWDATSGALRRTFEGHSDGVTGVAVSPDGRLLLSSSDDQTARLWDFQTGDIKQTFGPRNFICRRVRFSDDGHYFLVSSWDARARLYASNTGHVVLETTGGSDSADITADHRFMANTGGGTTAYVFQVNLAEPTAQQAQQLRDAIERFEHDDYGRREAATADILSIGVAAEPVLRAAMESEDAEVRLRSRRALQAVRSPEKFTELSGHAGDVEAICFSADDELLATGCRGGSLKIWTVPEFKEVLTLHAPQVP